MLRTEHRAHADARTFRAADDVLQPGIDRSRIADESDRPAPQERPVKEGIGTENHRGHVRRPLWPIRPQALCQRHHHERIAAGIHAQPRGCRLASQVNDDIALHTGHGRNGVPRPVPPRHSS